MLLPLVHHHVGYRRELNEQQVLNQSHRRLYAALPQAEEETAAGTGQDGPGKDFCRSDPAWAGGSMKGAWLMLSPLVLGLNEKQGKISPFL